MVDSTKKTVTEQIDTTTPTMDLDLTTKKMVDATIDNFREIQQAIFDDLSLHLSKVNDPQVNAKLAKDAVDVLLQQLQTVID